MTQALLVGGIALAGIFAFTQFGKKEPETEDAAIDQQVKVIIADIDKEIADVNKDLDKAIENDDAGVIEALVVKLGDLETDKVDVVVAGADAKAAVVDPVIVDPVIVDPVIVDPRIEADKIAAAELASQDNWREYKGRMDAELAGEFGKYGGYYLAFPAWEMGWDADGGNWMARFNKNFQIARQEGLDMKERMETAERIQARFDAAEVERLKDEEYRLDQQERQRNREIREAREAREKAAIAWDEFQDRKERERLEQEEQDRRDIELAEEQFAMQQAREQLVEADKQDFNNQKQNLYREFPDERAIINNNMRSYSSAWRNYQGDLRRQLNTATNARRDNDIKQFNNTKTRITNQYPDGAAVVRVWAYDEDWRDIEADVRADAREAHRARAEFKAQIAQAAADRAAAEQESGEDAAIDWRYLDDEDEMGWDYSYTPLPVATPVPVVRYAPPVKEESLWERRNRLAYEAAQDRALQTFLWDEDE